MNAQPVSWRILTALLLAPMDSRQLTTALSTDKHVVCMRLLQLHERGDVSRVGTQHRKRRPAFRYELTQQGKSWAEELIA